MTKANGSWQWTSLVQGILLATAMGAWGVASHAEVAVVDASRDNTLIESSTGNLSNGAGPAIFVGRTSQSRDSIRRGLVAFDLEGVIPAGSLVLAVVLELELTPSHDAESIVSVHRLVTDWGESASSASGGRGAPAQIGDATWLHRFFDDAPWSSPGGDFVLEPSASIVVGEPGLHAWPSSRALVADVQSWLDDAEANYGWILIGDEGRASTSKRFASREAEQVVGAEDEAFGPRLTIEFIPPCDEQVLRGASAALCSAYCGSLRCDDEEPRASSRACNRLANAFMKKTRGIPLVCGPPQE